MHDIRPFATGLWFAECPRWHDGALYLSDMWDHTVYRFDQHSARAVVIRFPDDEDPGGLGFLPDGRMLIVGMEGRCVYRLEGGRPVIHADLRDAAPYKCNDMVVAADGTAYVSQHGFDTSDLAGFAPTQLVRVRPDGSVDVAADELHIPNGVALNGDGSLLAVAESFASRIALFDVGADADLVPRGTWTLPATGGAAFAAPDGICFDSTDGLWVADVQGDRLLRFAADGTVTETSRATRTRSRSSSVGRTDARSTSAPVSTPSRPGAPATGWHGSTG